MGFDRLFARLAGAALLGVAACAHPALHAAGPIATLPNDSARAPFDATVLLIGDAGDPREHSDGRPEPVLRAAAAELRATRNRAAIVFLGDNVYPTGAPSDERDSVGTARARTILDRQVWLDGDATSAAPRWFVPGNHDWGDNGVRTSLFGVPRDGARRLAAQAAFLASLRARGADATVVPAAGCPGPDARDVGRWLRVIAIDTEWWLQDLALDAGACGGIATRDAAVDSLRRLLAASRDRRVIVVAHHPLATAGPHGGWYGGLAQLAAPLRIAAGWLTGRQDLTNRKNAATRHAIERALRDAHPLAYVAGHEHTLQVFHGGVADWYLVSGAGILGHASPVRCRRASTFASRESGFMRLDVTPSGDVRVRVIGVRADSVATRYERWLTRADSSAGSGANC